ncbi:hypothetical protein KP79_PYT10029 [Mizuhopecten yessoensis]|uniref:Uncharacterized protein n=1 Tax=Mizuhopecten yessoensis TaxID=6573 RepID=A0A210Q835_MIZYE|nr:hypothetical protein KP79_PYT10029 [Mizuhopecten yessoensis]
MSTAALQCLSSTVCVSLPEPIHPCALLPPSDPDVGVFPEVFNRIQLIKLSKPTWTNYTERCLGGGTTLAVTTDPITTTEAETTSVFHTVTHTLTEAVTNMTNVTADRGASTTDSDATNDWVIPVIVVVIIVIILLLAIVAIICKTCHHAKSSGDTIHPVDLQLHEDVNYLNNKAEVGAFWRGHNPDDIEDHGNTAETTGTSLSVSKETGSANGCNGDHQFLDSHKTKTLPEHNQPSCREEREISRVNLETPATARELASESPNLQSRRKPYPSPKPKKSDGKKRSRKSKSKKEDTSTIYANHQFEKLAKGHDNVVFEGDHGHKPLPPEPVPLDPLSRPLPPQPCEGNKPTPARRSRAKVSPSISHI